MNKSFSIFVFCVLALATVTVLVTQAPQIAQLINVHAQTCYGMVNAAGQVTQTICYGG